MNVAMIAWDLYQTGIVVGAGFTLQEIKLGIRPTVLRL